MHEKTVSRNIFHTCSQSSKRTASCQHGSNLHALYAALYYTDVQIAHFNHFFKSKNVVQ